MTGFILFFRTILMVTRRIGGRERMRAGCEMLLVCGGCNEESAGFRDAVNGRRGFCLEVPGYCSVSIQYVTYFVSNSKTKMIHSLKDDKMRKL